MTAPPIPTRLADRPTVAGLVVPWISVQHADGGAALGAVHASRQDACVRNGWCQIDGQHLGARIVLFARRTDLDRGYVVEPGFHPECAAYSAKACPMLTGRMAHYRSTPRHLTGTQCAVPGCDCAGWVEHDDGHEARANHPAERFFAVWIRAADYRPASAPNGDLLGVALPAHPLKVRPLHTAADTAALRLMEAT